MRLVPSFAPHFSANGAVDGFNDEQIAVFQATLEKDFGRPFTKAEALDALNRLHRFVRAVTNRVKSLKRPSKPGDHAASA